MKVILEARVKDLREHLSAFLDAISDRPEDEIVGYVMAGHIPGEIIDIG